MAASSDVSSSDEGEDKVWVKCWVRVCAKPESVNGVSMLKEASDPETRILSRDPVLWSLSKTLQ